MRPLPPRSTLFPYTTLFRSLGQAVLQAVFDGLERGEGSGVMSAGPLEHLFARRAKDDAPAQRIAVERSEEHTSELQSLRHLVCRLLLEKKKQKRDIYTNRND